MTLDRAIAAAIAIAAATLIGLGAAFAVGAFDSGSSGPPGSVSDECSKYALNKAQTAGVKDPFIKGVVTVGLKEGPDGPGAASLLNVIGTTYYMPLPYHAMAFVCVKPGYEKTWIDQMKALDWVEFAHTEGVHPILTLPQ